MQGVGPPGAGKGWDAAAAEGGNVPQRASNKDRQAAARSRTRTDAVVHPADQIIRRWSTRRAVRRSVGSPSQRFVALRATFLAAGCLVATFLVADFLVAGFATVFPAFSLPVFFESFFPSGPRPVLARVFT